MAFGNLEGTITVVMAQALRLLSGGITLEIRRLLPVGSDPDRSTCAQPF
jgi:hypothetical protein